ncbi:hypothetical protein HRG_012626 [Hirsutella rhossiliensis]
MEPRRIPIKWGGHYPCRAAANTWAHVLAAAVPSKKLPAVAVLGTVRLHTTWITNVSRRPPTIGLGQYLEEVLWETVSTRSPISAGTVDSIARKCQLNDSLAEIGAVEYPEPIEPKSASQQRSANTTLTAMPLTRHTRPERDDNKTFRVFQANEARSRRRTTAPSHSTTLSNTDAVLLQERWTEAKNSHCVVPAAKSDWYRCIRRFRQHIASPKPHPAYDTFSSLTAGRDSNSTERISDCSWQLLMPLHAQNALYAQKHYTDSHIFAVPRLG